MQLGAGRYGAIRAAGRADGHVLCQYTLETESCRVATELQGRRCSYMNRAQGPPRAMQCTDTALVSVRNNQALWVMPRGNPAEHFGLP